MGNPGLGATVKRDYSTDRTAGRARATLFWVFPETEGRTTSLDADRTIVGRDPTCDEVLASDQISRQHLELRRTGLIVHARDLGSTNGVFLNGAQVTDAMLKPRDVLRVGDWIGVVGELDVTTPADAPLFREISSGYWGGPTLVPRLEAGRRAAPSDLPIVIQGGTGAGKEGVARSIHLWSGRSGPFLALNCAALPESLAEGELFGYRRGAFTGAERANPGYLRAAHGGTLFLDEIVDLPLNLQAKLLRALEQREVIPLGESAPVTVDVRVLCATQAPLASAVEEGRFRPDLYARLDGLTIELPTLRERNEEVVFLFERLLRFRGGGRKLPSIDVSFAELLCLHDWPFNVRELDLLARQMIALHGDVPRLERAHLPDRLRGKGPRTLTPTPARPPPPRGEGPDIETFVSALRANQGNVKRAAAALGISRAKAYRLMDSASDEELSDVRKPDAAT